MGEEKTKSSQTGIMNLEKTLSLVEIQVFNSDKWKVELGLWPKLYDIISREEDFNLCSFDCTINSLGMSSASMHSCRNHMQPLRPPIRDIMP